MPGLALVIICAACSNAVCSKGGNDLPRFAARRRIPAQAARLKKNRGGIAPPSRTCDNEHATAALGESEMLSVENPPSEPCPRPGNHTHVRPSDDMALGPLDELSGLNAIIIEDGPPSGVPPPPIGV